MMKGLHYLQDIKKVNSDIHKLAQDIEMYERSKQHLDELIEEFNEYESILHILTRKYNKYYVPAMEKRLQLNNQLQLAKSDNLLYTQYVSNFVDDFSDEDIEDLISKSEASQGPKIKDLQRDSVDAEIASIDETLSDKNFRFSSNSASSSHKSFSSSSSKSSRVKSWSTFSIDTANEKRKSLQTRYSELFQQNRSVSKQTCLLTSQLKCIQEEITNLNSMMKICPNKIYEGLEGELSYYRIEALKSVISGRQENNGGDAESAAILESIGNVNVGNVLGLAEHRKKRSSVCSFLIKNDNFFGSIIT